MLDFLLADLRRLTRLPIRTRSFVVLGFGVLLLTLATGSLAQTVQSPPPDYFPLPVGATWNYKSVSSTGSTNETTFKVVAKERQADGSTWCKVEIGPAAPSYSWYSKPKGLVLLHRDAFRNFVSDYQPVKTVLKNPPEIGDSWAWKGKKTGPVAIEIEENSRVISTEAVVVPAGTFQTVKVITNTIQPPTTTTHWYANQVGLVKSSIDAGRVQSTMELVSYRFK